MTVLEAAGRLWDAAYALDELRGDRAASEWAARRVRNLLRSGRAEDPTAIAGLAGLLEARLERERGPR